MKAILVLQDGKAFEGQSFGATGERAGEVVFNTGLTGYQEIITDPSYKGQIVAMTYPHIGNVGINPEDGESPGLHLTGLIVRDLCPTPSNWRASEGLAEHLARHGVMALTGVDTRALTRHLRARGAMKGIISTESGDRARLQALALAAPSTSDVDLVAQVTCPAPYAWEEGTDPQWRLAWPPAAGRPWRVIAYDCGIKHNMLRLLVDLGCQVTVVPAGFSAAEVLALRPDGVLLSNGPGDPAPLTYLVETVRDLLGKVPIFGICLGHQILGQALGGKTDKLKFGHHGINQPVKNLVTGRVEISSQNHGFVVLKDTLPGDTQVTHINLNDGTLEGFKVHDMMAFSVQYHPEAAPGPHDSGYLFGRFREWIAQGHG